MTTSNAVSFVFDDHTTETMTLNVARQLFGLVLHLCEGSDALRTAIAVPFKWFDYAHMIHEIPLKTSAPHNKRDHLLREICQYFQLRIDLFEDGSAAEQSAFMGDLELLKCVHSLGSELTWHTLVAAINGGHLRIVQWLVANGCEMTPSAYDAAQINQFAHPEILAWLQEAGCPVPSSTPSWERHRLACEASGTWGDGWPVPSYPFHRRHRLACEASGSSGDDCPSSCPPPLERNVIPAGY